MVNEQQPHHQLTCGVKFETFEDKRLFVNRYFRSDQFCVNVRKFYHLYNILKLQSATKLSAMTANIEGTSNKLSKREIIGIQFFIVSLMMGNTEKLSLML